MLTDMVGYASLAQPGESLALRLLDERHAIARPVLAEVRDHEVKAMGDGFLVEIESALSATRCAVETQRHIEDRNRRDAGERIQLRIGLHVGDVVHVGGTSTGTR